MAMRVMVVGPGEPDSFADNVSHTLRRMGHDVFAIGPALRRTGQRRIDHGFALLAEHATPLQAALQSHLVAGAERFRPHVTITVDRLIGPSAIGRLHELGSLVYLWYPDAVSNLGRHDVFLAGYDRMYFKNPVLVQRLRDIQGLPVHYLPEACNPDWHRPQGEYGSNDYLAVVGNLYTTRVLLVDRLVRAGVPVRIFGAPLPGWVGFRHLTAHHSGREVHRQQKAAVFRHAVAVLNNVHPAEFAGTNCRLFEATASGALVLTEEREGLRDLFDVPGEVVTFSSFDELVDRYRQAREDRSWANAIADAAAIRSLRDHTYEVRLRTMLEH